MLTLRHRVAVVSMFYATLLQISLQYERYLIISLHFQHEILYYRSVVFIA